MFADPFLSILSPRCLPSELFVSASLDHTETTVAPGVGGRPKGVSLVGMPKICVIGSIASCKLPRGLDIERADTAH
jgi:hypothetical protein